MLEPITPAGLALPAGPYAHAVRAQGLIFVSGLLAMDEGGATIGPGDAAAQAAYIFIQLANILDAAGADLSDVAKLGFYLTNLADRTAITPVRLRVFGTHRPASTLVQVAGLIGDGTVIEIEAIAVAKPCAA